MRRIWVSIILLLLACRALTPAGQVSPDPLLTSRAPTSAAPSLSATPPPPATPSQGPSPTDSPSATVEATSTLQVDPPYSIRLHPDGPLYIGDLVSVEVIAPPETDLSGMNVMLSLPVTDEQELIQGVFSPYGIGSRQQATFLWAWDTSGLPTGEHTLTFSVEPDGLTWTETVYLFPDSQVPPPEPEAAWAVEESDCCLVYYITGTDADRDIQALLSITDEQTKKAAQRLKVELEDPILVTFLPRVLGHGGFAGGEISISYLDQNYAGGDFETILHHEIVHVLDSRLGGELRPTLFIEGLAVYLSGGHYKPEPLMARAAALLPAEPGCVQASTLPARSEPPAGEQICGLDLYVPLKTLVDEFYASQHEIGYLQAGALVEYMVRTWGWQAFSDFYRSIKPQPETTGEEPEKTDAQSRALQAALRDNFGISLEQLEQRFLEALEEEQLTAVNAEDVRLLVYFYETMRRYQQLLDPSAFFLTAWLPDGSEMRKRDIVADYLRRPDRPENQTLEAMLVRADQELLGGDHFRAEQILNEVNTILDGLSTEEDQGLQGAVSPASWFRWGKE